MRFDFDESKIAHSKMITGFYFVEVNLQSISNLKKLLFFEYASISLNLKTFIKDNGISPG